MSLTNFERPALVALPEDQLENVVRNTIANVMDEAGFVASGTASDGQNLHQKYEQGPRTVYIAVTVA